MSKPNVVIIGGGFGGLSVAKNLKRADVNVTLIDKTNYHLFQPLLYQVASAALSPGDIATPLRHILRKQKNATVLMGKVTGIDASAKTVTVDEETQIPYDYLIVATGNRHSYFGNDHWEAHAPGLKTVQDAIRIRERMLRSFEKAERSGKPENVAKYLTFVVVGAGPTGVEVAGAIAEIAQKNIQSEFRRIDTSKTKVMLVEAGPRVLAAYPEPLSDAAKRDLEKLGVEVMIGKMVTNVSDSGVEIDGTLVPSENVIWAAGNATTSINKAILGEKDRAGRAIVGSDCAIPDHPNLFVIGDAAHFVEDGKPLPGVAQVALQQGKFVADIIKKRTPQSQRKAFHYNDLGSMATIGRAKAVAWIGSFKFGGLIAWLLWSLVHVRSLISFRNQYKVMAEWIWYYISHKNGIRLITQIPSSGKLAENGHDVKATIEKEQAVEAV